MISKGCPEKENIILLFLHSLSSLRCLNDIFIGDGRHSAAQSLIHRTMSVSNLSKAMADGQEPGIGRAHQVIVKHLQKTVTIDIGIYQIQVSLSRLLQMTYYKSEKHQNKIKKTQYKIRPATCLSQLLCCSSGIDTGFCPLWWCCPSAG